MRGRGERSERTRTSRASTGVRGDEGVQVTNKKGRAERAYEQGNEREESNEGMSDSDQ